MPTNFLAKNQSARRLFTPAMPEHFEMMTHSPPKLNNDMDPSRTLKRVSELENGEFEEQDHFSTDNEESSLPGDQDWTTVMSSRSLMHLRSRLCASLLSDAWYEPTLDMNGSSSLFHIDRSDAANHSLRYFDVDECPEMSSLSVHPRSDIVKDWAMMSNRSILPLSDSVEDWAMMSNRSVYLTNLPGASLFSDAWYEPTWDMNGSSSLVGTSDPDNRSLRRDEVDDWAILSDVTVHLTNQPGASLFSDAWYEPTSTVSLSPIMETTRMSSSRQHLMEMATSERPLSRSRNCPSSGSSRDSKQLALRRRRRLEAIGAASVAAIMLQGESSSSVQKCRQGNH